MRFLVALLVVAGCTKAAPTSRITIATTVEPDVLSPFLSESGAAHEVMALFARDLVQTDPTWKNVPDLAVEVAQGKLVDGKLVVDWQIRDGALWEDGTAVTANDFIFAWRVQADDAQEVVVGRDNAKRIESMVATSPKSFTVTWREPTPFYADPRVHRPLPSHVVAKRMQKLKDDPIARAPLSNGPFRLVEHVPGQHFLFKRNERYSPKPAVDEVLVRVVPSTTSALTMLSAGEIDLIFPSAGPSPNEARAYAASRPDVELATAPGQVWAHIDFNLDDPTLSDVRVRRALALALPRDEILRAISGGLYETAHTYLPPKHWGHAALPPLGHDVASARRLLDEAGWTAGADGMRKNAEGDALTLELAAASEVKETAELLQFCVKAWKDVGVEVTLDLRPFKVFFGEGARKRKLKHMSFYSWTLDGTSMGGALWRSDKIPTEANGFKGQNLPGWRNDEVTALLTKADATLDLAERQRMLKRVQEVVRDEMPAIPMYFRPVVVVHKQGIRGIRPTGTLTPLAWNAHEWSR